MRIKRCKKSKDWSLFFLIFIFIQLPPVCWLTGAWPEIHDVICQAEEDQWKMFRTAQKPVFFVVFVALGMSRTRFACVPLGTKLVGHSNAGLGAFREVPTISIPFFDVENP